MKLIVEKLGLIDRAEFDIRPLTVLIGENSTNKTWVAYSLYGLVRSLLERIPSSPPLPVERHSEAEVTAGDRFEEESRPLAEELARRSSDSVSLDLDFSKYLPGGLADYELTGDRFFLNELLRLPPGHEASVIKLQLGRLELRHESGPVRVEVVRAVGGIMQILQMHSGRSLQQILHQDAATLRQPAFWRNMLADAFLRWAQPALSGVFILPAERKALASAYDLLRDEFAETMSVPVADYAEFLRRSRNLMAHQVAPIKRGPLREAAELLEARIVKGAIGFSRDAEETRFSFTPTPQTELPIHAASSLVRALAGLDLYLQTSAQPGDFLFIDELEMNAHPEAQLALTELIGLLVNRGLRVILTTHSPFVVEHLNNLMAAARLRPEQQDVLRPSFHLQERDAFVPADNVAAYHFAPVNGKVEVRDVMDRDSETIDWRTFSRITDELSNLFGRILEMKERT